MIIKDCNLDCKVERTDRGQTSKREVSRNHHSLFEANINVGIALSPLARFGSIKER